MNPVERYREHRSLAGCETEDGLRILIAKADAALAEETARVEKADVENERLNRMLRSACRMWALCCEPAVVKQPRVRNAGEALAWLREHDKEGQP